MPTSEKQSAASNLSPAVVLDSEDLMTDEVFESLIFRPCKKFDHKYNQHLFVVEFTLPDELQTEARNEKEKHAQSVKEHGSSEKKPMVEKKTTKETRKSVKITEEMKVDEKTEEQEDEKLARPRRSSRVPPVPTPVPQEVQQEIKQVAKSTRKSSAQTSRSSDADEPTEKKAKHATNSRKSLKAVNVEPVQAVVAQVDEDKVERFLTEDEAMQFLLSSGKLGKIFLGDLELQWKIDSENEQLEKEEEEAKKRQEEEDKNIPSTSSSSFMSTRRSRTRSEHNKQVQETSDAMEID